MKHPTSMGMNRTGIQMAPQEVQALIRDTSSMPPSSAGDARTLIDYKRPYFQDADPIGTVPMPGTVKGAAKAGMQKLMGRHAEVLIDKLGARLAFERTGTRLYEAFLGKCQVRTDEADSLPIEQLQKFQAEEAAHLAMVWEAMRQLGADPTAVTPMADVDAIASIGLMQILADPRTSVGQCLHAIHVAELSDNDGWQLLIKLANELGQDEMAVQFERALAEEDRHLAVVRDLVEKTCLREAGA